MGGPLHLAAIFTILKNFNMPLVERGVVQFNRR
jgi:hypothetical protein